MKKQKGGDLIDHLNVTSILYIIGMIVLLISVVYIFLNTRMSAILLLIGLSCVLMGGLLSPLSR